MQGGQEEGRRILEEDPSSTVSGFVWTWHAILLSKGFLSITSSGRVATQPIFYFIFLLSVHTPIITIIDEAVDPSLFLSQALLSSPSASTAADVSAAALPCPPTILCYSSPPLAGPPPPAPLLRHDRPQAGDSLRDLHGPQWGGGERKIHKERGLGLEMYGARTCAFASISLNGRYRRRCNHNPADASRVDPPTGIARSSRTSARCLDLCVCACVRV